MTKTPVQVSKETDKQLSSLYSELAQCAKTITDWHDRAGRVTNHVTENPNNKASLDATANPEQTKLIIKHATHGDFVEQAEEALAKAAETVREIKRVRRESGLSR